MSNRKLWIEGKTAEDIEFYSEIDSDNVIYNLHEDCLCLKEKNDELKAMANELREAIMQINRVPEGIAGLYNAKDVVINKAPAQSLADHDMRVAEKVREVCMLKANFEHLDEYGESNDTRYSDDISYDNAINDCITAIRNIDLSEVIKDE